MVVHARLDPVLHPWILDPRVTRLFDALEDGQDSDNLRFVGGIVRDSLLGRTVDDIDFATSLPPLLVMERLMKAGLPALPTGLSHGTVTTVMEGHAYEITTLRHDVETDGRHATVSFTADWAQDAARRDFTMNALYADRTGLVYDYHGGLIDLEKGIIRFIGDPSARIEEDVLRILRFFRFTAWYGRGEPSEEALYACARHASKLPQLSAERVWKELRRLLLAPNPLVAFVLMRQSGVIAALLPEMVDFGCFEATLQSEPLLNLSIDPIARMTALVGDDKALAQRLKLSHRDIDHMDKLVRLGKRVENECTLENLRTIFYESQKGSAQEDPDLSLALTAIVLTLARKGDGRVLINRDRMIAAQKAWHPVPFPLRGDDVLALGIPPSPKVGQLLSSVEAWWIAADFLPNRAACLDYLAKATTSA